MSLAFLSGGVGWQEVLLVLVVVLIFFGAKRLPELARSLGKSLGEFKKGRDEGMAADKDGSMQDEKGEDPPPGA